MAVPSNGHPPFFRLAVLLVKDGHGLGVQKELGSTLEADSVLAQILLRLDGVPLEIVTQRSGPGRNAAVLTIWASPAARFLGGRGHAGLRGLLC